MKLVFSVVLLIILITQAHSQNFNFSDSVFKDGAKKVLMFESDSTSHNKYKNTNSFDSLYRFLYQHKELNVIIKYFVKFNYANSNYQNYYYSNKRAIEIKDYLVKRRINKRRIYAIGVGSGQCSNDFSLTTLYPKKFCETKIQVEIFNPKTASVFWRQ